MAVGAHHDQVGAQVEGARQDQVAHVHVGRRGAARLGAHAVAREKQRDVRARGFSMALRRAARLDRQDGDLARTLQQRQGVGQRARRLRRRVPARHDVLRGSRDLADIGGDQHRPAHGHQQLVGEVRLFLRRGIGLIEHHQIGIAGVQRHRFGRIALGDAPFVPRDSARLDAGVELRERLLRQRVVSLPHQRALGVRFAFGQRVARHVGRGLHEQPHHVGVEGARQLRGHPEAACAAAPAVHRDQKRLVHGELLDASGALAYLRRRNYRRGVELPRGIQPPLVSRVHRVQQRSP